MPEHHALTGGEARSCEGFNDRGKSCAQMDNCCKSCDPITWEFNFQLALARVHFTVTLTLTNTPNTHMYICLGFRTDHNYMDLSAAFLTACLGLKPTKRFPLSILYLDILGHLGIDCAAPPEFAAKPSRSEELHIAFDGRLISEQSRGELHDCDESPPRGLVRWVDDGFVILIYIYWCISHIHTYIHIQMNIYIYYVCVRV